MAKPPFALGSEKAVTLDVPFLPRVVGRLAGGEVCHSKGAVQAEGIRIIAARMTEE